MNESLKRTVSIVTVCFNAAEDHEEPGSRAAYAG